MSHLGSPSAGWYTDPTGEHRARFWDGAAWTGQVRDDLGAPGPAPPGEPPVLPTAAATVASVAEAVAAVAQAEVGSSGADATFVVDLGVDEDTWGQGPGTNGGHAAWGEARGAAPGNAGDVAAGDPSHRLPVAGWYPDPAGRFEARYWDGTTWTERVADRGSETVDPLPGAATGAGEGLGEVATDGAWSVQLLGAAGVDYAPSGVGGELLTAGQASLAQLPEPEEREPERPRLERPAVKVRVGGGMVLGGAAALLVGSTMPWLEVRGPRVNDAWSSTGMQIGDGRITIVLSLVLAVLGALIVTGRMSRVGGPKVAAMGALVAGASALAVSAVDIADVAERASRLGVPPGAVSDVGTGLWLAFVGSLLAVCGGLMAFANRR